MQILRRKTARKRTQNRAETAVFALIPPGETAFLASPNEPFGRPRHAVWQCDNCRLAPQGHSRLVSITAKQPHHLGCLIPEKLKSGHFILQNAAYAIAYACTLATASRDRADTTAGEKQRETLPFGIFFVTLHCARGDWGEAQTVSPTHCGRRSHTTDKDKTTQT